MMSSAEIVDLSSDDELGDVDIKPVKLEPGTFPARILQSCHGSYKSNGHPRLVDSEDNRSSHAQSSTSALEQVLSPLDDTSISSSSHICPPPICRQFWKAGQYDGSLSSKISLQNGKNYLHVHPMFLHSNATSHKWAFGAIAELLDNAIDEIQNGATFVLVDKTTNPRDGSPALLVQDDGGGMDPQAMRQCMGFGFSDKKSTSAIGRYGNGFKTSSMRLGADAIVLSRLMNDGTRTQSIGLLSYTFLTQTGHDRIVVPIVDYEFDASTSTYKALHGGENFISNLSILLKWSPFSSEAELHKQCDEIGPHGTKIILYSLWFNDDGKYELDFESDPEDIRISGDIKKVRTRRGWQDVNEKHIANQFHYSLRVYLSILYLRVPESFKMVLRGKVVEHHNIADDLKYPEYILYRPQTGGSVEGTVVTTIGFLKEAPQVLLHGFCVYHKNRLILPYWQVVNYSDSRGRGVVGVLEANFVEPTHNKQDFERTSLLQKLENRLKEMTWEYWDYHCGLIGYQVKKKARASLPQSITSDHTPGTKRHQRSSAVQKTQLTTTPPVQPMATKSYEHLVKREGESTPFSDRLEPALHTKRKEHPDLVESGKLKRLAGTGVSVINTGRKFGTEVVNTIPKGSMSQEALNLIQENKKLRSKCAEHEMRSKELHLKVLQLRSQIGERRLEQKRLIADLQSMVKEEKTVDM